jgi:hypothetical protein
MIDYTWNYQREWKKHMNRMITGRLPEHCMLSAKRTKISLMSNEEMGGNSCNDQQVIPHEITNKEGILNNLKIKSLIVYIQKIIRGSGRSM